jgi:hypothetical protein
MNTTNYTLDLLYIFVIAEGGDGDAIWLSKHVSLDNLVDELKKYNIEKNTKWEIKIFDNHILWGRDQEWVIITDDKLFFESQPSWITLKLDY